jgi:hypothetical protein
MASRKDCCFIFGAVLPDIARTLRFKTLTNALPSYNEIFDHVEDWQESFGTRLRDTTPLQRGMWVT